MKMKKKKGFTLIEIIICIALISIIATTMTITIVKNKRKNELNILEKNSTKLENALQVYLTNHKEVTYNLKNNAKAAAITLEVLKNEGLIDDTLKIDNYKKKYFLVSNAKLLDPKDGKDESDCENDVVGVEIFKSWDLSKDANGNKVIYVCPKNNSSSSNDNAITGLQQQVDSLKKIINGITLTKIFEGENPNNWVKFEVNSNENNYAYWPNDNEKDLWRIYNYDQKYINGEYVIVPKKIIYNKEVKSNNYKFYSYVDSTGNDTLVFKESSIRDLLNDNRYKDLFKEFSVRYPSDKSYSTTEKTFSKKYECQSSIYELNGNYFTRSSSQYNTCRGCGYHYYFEKSSSNIDSILNNTTWCRINNYGNVSTGHFTSKDGFTYVDFTVSGNNGNEVYSTKIQQLFNAIDNEYKKYIVKEKYYDRYYQPSDLPTTIEYNQSGNYYLGVINGDEINAIANRNNWLVKLMGGKYLGYMYRVSSERTSVAYYESTTGYIYGTSVKSEQGNSVYMNTIGYIPAISLNQENEETNRIVYVSSGTGSKDDPYILKCDNC